jgi:NAD(P)-dependent dehydrogenase (short-subunit alcohol dehydrogenase family)
VEVHTRKFDAADEKATKEVVDHAVQTYGRLDIFFANAGIVGSNKLFSDISGDEFLATLRTNVVRYLSILSICSEIPIGIERANRRTAYTSQPNTAHQP